jgi:glyoxylase-like metal-dependent hydrolase (beta-lactamase superfamily II)
VTASVAASAESWTDLGCFPISAGVYRVPLTMPMDGLRAVNVYVVETRDGLALIDGGWHVDSAFDELADALRSIGRTPSEISDVYVTHIHRDHFTFAIELRRRFGSRVHLGRPEGPGLDEVIALQDNRPVSSLRELRRADAPALAEVVEAITAAEPFDPNDWQRPDTWLDAGRIDLGSHCLDVVPTPGHTKGHMVFHDVDNGLLFSGDHVLPTITPSIGFELGAWDLPLGHYLDSLQLLLERPDARLLPAHGYPTGSVHDRVRELLKHHDRRLAHTLAVLGSGGGSMAAHEVAGGLTWTRRLVSFDSLDAFNAMIAICETLAHLDLLVATSRAVVETVGDVDRFSPQD